MYKSIVKRRVRSLFAAANRGNWQAIVDALGPSFAYRFIGDTPLGGTRTTKPAMQQWFARIYRLMPQEIVVEGLPWNTRVMTYVKFQGTLPPLNGAKGTAYENEVMQLLRIRWGRIVVVTTLEDTQRFINILPQLAAAGLADATAGPITDASVRPAIAA
jgi:ketosteroid isomerase-like protein